MRYLFLTVLIFFSTLSFATKPRDKYVKVKTTYGEVFIKLYNETPKHRDNFLKITKNGMLNGTLFHRVIKNFMIQGGDPDSKKAKAGEMLGAGDLGYRIDAEFVPNLIHKRGAVAAARNNNPERASSASQFYIVDGKKFNDTQLNYLEQDYGRKLSEQEREIYKTIGGAPFLDQEYTVFGEVIKGIEMLDKITTLRVDGNNRPLEDVKMEVTILKNREVKKLNKELSKTK